MSPTFYHILHVFSVLVMTGYTFYAFAADPSTRKRTLIISGIASLVALIAGFGLQAKLSVGFPGWLIVKIVCWLGLSALVGIGYRRRGAAGALALIALVLAFIAVVMVYLKPF
jgi:apolipoprotein N-acyltransferase